MRTVAIGDIHGCYQELLQLLDKVQLTPEDCLISLGDIVDRGPDSVQVYDFLRKRPNTIVLMGNHERKHLRQTLSYSQDIVKLQFGDRYPEFLEWVGHLPYYYETEQAIFVHAALENGLPMESQREEILCGCNAGERYLEKQYGKAYWSQFYTGKKPVIFGHHVVGDAPLVTERNGYGIDTGACHGGRLTALILPGFETVQVQAVKDYWHEEKIKWQLPVMMSKPWETYRWGKIHALVEDLRYSSNPKIVAFVTQKEEWVNELLALAPIAICKVEEKLAELIALHGADEFKQQAHHLPYAPLLFKANSSQLTTEFLQQALPTPEQWLQTMMALIPEKKTTLKKLRPGKG